MLAEVGFCVCICGRVFEEDAELTVEAALDALAVGGEGGGVCGKGGTFLGGEDVLLKALDGGDPSGLADEGGEFLDMGLDGGEDLDAGGAEGVSVSIRITDERYSYPFPMSPTWRPRRSILSSQLAVCKSTPLYLSRPGMAGHAQLFRMPEALIRMSQWSRTVWPDSRSWTCTS